VAPADEIGYHHDMIGIQRMQDPQAER
jgi:hypothetical protein